jgi:hypothetical protein
MVLRLLLTRNQRVRPAPLSQCQRRLNADPLCGELAQQSGGFASAQHFARRAGANGGTGTVEFKAGFRERPAGSCGR